MLVPVEMKKDETTLKKNEEGNTIIKVVLHLHLTASLVFEINGHRSVKAIHYL